MAAVMPVAMAGSIDGGGDACDDDRGPLMAAVMTVTYGGPLMAAVMPVGMVGGH